MTHVLKNSLLMLAVAFATVAQTNDANAQVVPPTSADAGEANVILDLSTGEALIQIGADLLIFGIEGVPFDNAAAADGVAAIVTQGGGPQVTAFQNDTGGIGFLNLNTSELPIGEFSLGIILTPDFRSESALNDFNLLFGSLDFFSDSAPENVFFIRSESIPEPGSLSLLALAGLGAVARRRR